MCCIIVVQMLHFGNLLSVDMVKDFIDVLNCEIWIICPKKKTCLKNIKNFIYCKFLFCARETLRRNKITDGEASFETLS